MTISKSPLQKVMFDAYARSNALYYAPQNKDRPQAENFLRKDNWTRFAKVITAECEAVL
jgi:hypothetical protein